MNKKLNIVTVGGGTGSYVVLKALKSIKNISIKALVTTMDDGGIARKERDEFGMLPQSDLRKAVVALSPESGETILRELFTYRFDRGIGLEGVTLGNLMMTALADLEGSQERAISKIQKILNIKGEVVPITTEKTNILITLSNGKQILGETSLDHVFWNGKRQISKIQLIPNARISRTASVALREADLIFITPGDLYGSVIVNFCTQGFKESVKLSKAKLVYTCNLFTKYGQTYGYNATQHIKDLEKYIGKKLDIIVLNNGKYNPKSLVTYAKEKASPVTYKTQNLKRYKLYIANLLTTENTRVQKGDKLPRSIVRHNHRALYEVYKKILKPH